MEGQAILLAHAGEYARDLDGGEAADDTYACNSIRELPGTRSGVRGPAGDSQHRETVQPEGRCELDHVVRPMDERATGLIVRETHARPVDGDQLNVPLPCRLVRKTTLDPRPWPAVVIEEGPAFGIAPFRIAKSAAVSKSDCSVCRVLHEGSVERTGRSSRLPTLPRHLLTCCGRHPPQPVGGPPDGSGTVRSGSFENTPPTDYHRPTDRPARQLRTRGESDAAVVTAKISEGPEPEARPRRSEPASSEPLRSSARTRHPTAVRVRRSRSGVAAGRDVGG